VSTSGRTVTGHGWESQLLESGLLAIFLCPLLDGRPFPKRAPPVVVLWRLEVKPDRGSGEGHEFAFELAKNTQD
jgi:hypothetical protein